MNNRRLTLTSLLHAAGVVLYVLLVALLISNADRLWGPMDQLISIAAFLLLFTVSAALTGLLVLGKPVLLYLDGKKREAILLFGATLGWLFVGTILLLAAMVR